jgi:putative phage-type endonuclease
MKDVRIIPVWDKTEEEWLEIRKGGIGGSDAGTICGVNKYKSPYALWTEKTKIVPTTFTGNDATKWGHRLERVVAEAYAEDYNKAVVEWPVIIWSEKYPWMFANLDFLIVDPSDEFPAGEVQTWRFEYEPPGIQGILEVKTAGIASPGSLGAWANNGIPQSYMLQGYHYGVVADIKDITFAALVGGQGLQVRHMEWDEKVAENLIILEERFWEQVTLEVAPETDGSDATESALSARYPRHEEGKGIEGGETLQQLWNEFSAAKEAAEIADTQRKSLRAKILEMIGDAEFATVNGIVILSYKASKGVESLDTDRLKKEMPEIWEEFKKVRNGSRVLRGIK